MAMSHVEGDMFEMLRDPIWQFVAVVLALAGVLVPIILFLRQRGRKQVGYEILAQTPLVSVRGGLEEEVVVLFAGQIVENVHLVMLRIVNSGNLPITTGEFESPVTLEFGPDSQVLTAEISDTSPDDLEAVLVITESKRAVRLLPCLLNHGDSITIRMLVSEFTGDMHVAGRIVGVARIQQVAVRRLLPQPALGLVLLVLQVALLLVWLGAVSKGVLLLFALATVGLLANAGYAVYRGETPYSQAPDRTR